MTTIKQNGTFHVKNFEIHVFCMSGCTKKFVWSMMEEDAMGTEVLLFEDKFSKTFFSAGINSVCRRPISLSSAAGSSSATTTDPPLV